MAASDFEIHRKELGGTDSLTSASGKAATESLTTDRRPVNVPTKKTKKDASDCLWIPRMFSNYGLF